MKLSVSGHPLHTRSLTVTTTLRDDGRHALEAAVIDLRKGGFVPVAGLLQPAGIIHHMTLTGEIDPDRRVIERLTAAQPTRPFEPCALTQGECCGDPLPSLERLSGLPLDDQFIAELRRVFGGPRGCSHLLSLAQMVASSVPYGLDREACQPEGSRARRAGERVFHRAIEIDGYELEGDLLQVVVQATDLHFAAAPEIASPMDHFGAQAEVHISATVDIARDMALGSVVAFERRRDLVGLEAARFVDRSSQVQFLEGQNVMGGMSKRVLAVFGDDPQDNPLLDALLMLAPGFLQSLASLSERWPEKAKADSALLGITGRPDSCYMWRSDGPVMGVGATWAVADDE
ncbi:MAG: DUF2889 domain-containing protein [bacterium]|nr:DUF2889 domain-containing protein [bacterium]